ncbi:hypothetical protein M885DRAFT_520323 [Pelagophyceae sp. CCMP2097]|nr:hypothetical protein M885DRAFT_520323 [Pelagophyceae sp. CCMP2097]
MHVWIENDAADDWKQQSDEIRAAYYATSPLIPTCSRHPPAMWVEHYHFIIQTLMDDHWEHYDVEGADGEVRQVYHRPARSVRADGEEIDSDDDEPEEDVEMTEEPERGPYRSLMHLVMHEKEFHEFIQDWDRVPSWCDFSSFWGAVDETFLEELLALKAKDPQFRAARHALVHELAGEREEREGVDAYQDLCLESVKQAEDNRRIDEELREFGAWAEVEPKEPKKPRRGTAVPADGEAADGAPVAPRPQVQRRVKQYPGTMSQPPPPPPRRTLREYSNKVIYTNYAMRPPNFNECDSASDTSDSDSDSDAD